MSRELEERFGIIEKFAECFEESRDPSQTEHPIEQFLHQRNFGRALGYEDLVDHESLSEDPLLAVVCGKEDPESHESLHETDAQPLAGKSTLNRFELGVVGDGPEDRHKKIVCDLARIEVLLGKYWVEMIDEPPSTVVLDFDATDIPLHGDQEDKFFHGY